MNKIRVAVVNTHPIQYFAPLYAYLNRDERLDVTALYCTDIGIRGHVDPEFKQAVKWDVDLLAGYRAVFLGKRAATRELRDGFWSLIAPEVWSEIRSGRYDAAWLHGYYYASHILAFLAAKSKGLPVFLRAETHLGMRRSKWKWRAHKLLISQFLKHVDGCLAIGTANRQYYKAMGVPESKIFDVPYTVDNARFIATAALNPEEREAVRARFALPSGKPVVLYAAKFIRRKHPDDLIRAAALLRERGYDFTVFMVGTGEMDEELRALVKELQLTNVVFGGFVNQTELPRAYAASDVFVLPSESEAFGLTVNEVMCAGIPVVVSDEVGCVPDLVKDDINGYRIKAGSPHSLAAALEKLLADPAKRAEMGRQSLKIMDKWSYEQCRTGLWKALASTVPRLKESRK